MSKSAILIVHLRERISEARIRVALAAAMGIAQDDLAPLEAATPSTLVPYEHTPRSKGFLTTIAAYAGQAPPSAPRSDLDLARVLAKHLGQDALISPDDADPDPFRWILVRPDGSTTVVNELPSDDDGIVIVEPPAPGD